MLHPVPGVQQLPKAVQAAFGVINANQMDAPSKKRRVTCTFGRSISGLEVYKQLSAKEDGTYKSKSKEKESPKPVDRSSIPTNVSHENDVPSVPTVKDHWSDFSSKQS